MEKNVHEIDYLRIFATISIVIWHCFYCPIGTWGLLPEDATSHFIMKTYSFLIPDADMPLFTFISGYLFYFLYKEKGKYRDFFPFLAGKFKRLLVPFFVFGLLIPITCYNQPTLVDFVCNKMVWGEGAHMWYCAMLFWCFMYAFLLLKLKNKVVTAIFCLFSLTLCCMYELFWTLPFKLTLGAGNACYYFVYFFAGDLAFNYKKEIKEKLVPNRRLLLAGYLLLALVFRYFKPILPFQVILFAIMLLVFVLHFLGNGKLVYNEKIARTSRMCFGVYIFHHWLAWNACFCPYLTPIFQQHYILFTVSLTIIVGILSVFLVNLSLKSRIGRFLLA